MRRSLASHAAVALATLLLAPALFVVAVSWWADSSDEARPSDAIVVLSGAYARSLYAARLYAEKYGPEIWLSRPKRSASDLEVVAAGVPLPYEPDVHRALLAKRGVPPSKVRLYGKDVGSTVDEAAALRAELGDTTAKLLIVTSRYHVRRTRLIFRRYLPRADVRVVAVPTETGTSWWRRKEASEYALLEPFKLANYLLQRLRGGLPPVR